jgi:ribosomal protein S18 acetylase RimI-like enzyme
VYEGAVQRVRLVPLTPVHRALFVEEELANYGDEQVRDSGWEPDTALERARLELGPVLERELAEAAEREQRLWTALDSAGEPVGWLWVTPVEDEPRTTFLYQITVAASLRRRGYGRAMLSALEGLLAHEGVRELRLNVSPANEPARRMYAASGYELIGQDERRCRMRKQLMPSS